jgi:hypothetical protein
MMYVLSLHGKGSGATMTGIVSAPDLNEKGRILNGNFK